MESFLGGFASLGFIITTLAFLRNMIPREFQDVVWEYVMWLSAMYINVHVNEFSGGYDNQLYSAIDAYLTKLIWKSHLLSFNVALPKNASEIRCELPNKEKICDTFKGVNFWWILQDSEEGKSNTRESYWPSRKKSNNSNKFFTLTVHRRYKYTVLPEYLDHIRSYGKQLEHEQRDKLIYTNAKRDPYEWPYKSWRSVPFKHPSTFDSMAMQPELKDKIIKDITKFMASEASYRQAGKAWKRGYLLYGPPGTGKSSLIGAIANFTGYDVYDLELTEVESNGQLRKLLMDIKNKSIIVIEDIDCSIELKKRGQPAKETDKEKEEDGEKKKKDKDKQRVTLSGLLNFTDGLWSGCANERIIIFTTNHIEQLDPALLRSGRMDMKIHLSYATFEAFKVLAWTHLRVKEHHLFKEIEDLFAVEDVEITPADVNEVLVQNGGEEDVLSALEGLIKVLKDPTRKKKEEAMEVKSEGETSPAQEPTEAKSEGETLPAQEPETETISS